MTTKFETVLAIDDDKIFNFLTKRSFEDAGLKCNLVFRTTAEEAMEYLQQPDNPFPDLILLDINLPKASGWDFLQQYKSNGMDARATRIIVLSVSARPLDLEGLMVYPQVVDWIEKPITVATVDDIRNKYFL